MTENLRSFPFFKCCRMRLCLSASSLPLLSFTESVHINSVELEGSSPVKKFNAVCLDSGGLMMLQVPDYAVSFIRGRSLK